VAEPLERKAGIHPPTAPGEFFDGPRVASQIGAAPPMVEPAGDLAGHHSGAFVLGHIGDTALRREPVEIHQATEAVGLGVGQLDHQRAALAVPDDRGGVLGDGVHHGHGVANIGVPAVQRGVITVAVAALIPGHDPPSGGRQLGREDLIGPAEIEPAVD
jgi:hypothetical protein